LLLVDGYNLLPAKLQTFIDKREAVQERIDGLGDTAQANGPTGLSKITLAQGGAFFDDTAHGMHEAFKAIHGVARTLMYSFTGGAHVTTVAGVYNESYSVIAQQGKLTKANVTYEVTGVPDDTGRLIQPLQTYTAAWDTKTTPIDLGAGVPDAALTVVVSDLTGFTSVAITVEHSDDAAAWSTLATVPPITTAPSSTKVANLGAVKRYVALAGVPAGAGSVTLAAILNPLI
jgi:hypothetical protein